MKQLNAPFGFRPQKAVFVTIKYDVIYYITFFYEPELVRYSEQ